MVMFVGLIGVIRYLIVEWVNPTFSFYIKNIYVGWSLPYALFSEPVSAINHLQNKDRNNK